MTEDTIVKKNVFKENWTKEDKVCPNCGQVTERVRGMTKQNLKRLFSIKWDVNELLLTFMIVMILVLAFAYSNETKMCREWISPMQKADYDGCMFLAESKCKVLQEMKLNGRDLEVPILNLTNYNTNEQQP